MKLSEFANMFLSCPENTDTAKLYIFRTEESAESWINYHYFGKDTKDWVLIGVYHSDYKMDRCFKESLCNEEVEYFWSVAQDTMVVILKQEEN